MDSNPRQAVVDRLAEEYGSVFVRDYYTDDIWRVTVPRGGQFFIDVRGRVTYKGFDQVESTKDEKQRLIRHLRRHHPNLLDGTLSGSDYMRALAEDRPIAFANGALPSSGLSEVPWPILDAVHQAAHMGLYFPHTDDDWLCREHEAKKASDKQ